MPQGQMLITLKGIAETLLSLLTLLLQVMMRQIETNPALESEEESPHQSETQAMMNNMMQELQSQRNLLQEMMNQQSRVSRSEAASGPPTGRLSLPSEGTTRRGLNMNRPSMETTSQQSWSVLEEEEILLVWKEYLHNAKWVEMRNTVLHHYRLLEPLSQSQMIHHQYLRKSMGPRDPDRPEE